MGLADLHIHSIYSDGTSTIAAVLGMARSRNLNVVAITDHDTLKGVAEARALAPVIGVEVISGCEISTADGHLLALFIENPIPPGRPLLDTLRLVREQGGLCIAPHPMAQGVSSLTPGVIAKAIHTPLLKDTLIAIEVYNASLLNPATNRRARILCEEYGLTPVAGSDAHIATAIGSGITRFPGQTVADLKQALLLRQTLPLYWTRRRTLRFWLDHLYFHALHRLGWVTAISEEYTRPLLQRVSRIPKPTTRPKERT
ncbi:MAG: CehA/McbA family metallohydrolase [Anaerolineales bacterium]